MFPDLNEIKHRRKKIGINQIELARKSDVSQSLIAKIESKKVEPSYNSIKKIFEVLDDLENKKGLKARDIMNRKLLCLEKTDKVNTAIKWMKKYDVSQIPVCVGKQVVGGVSEKTILDNLMNVGKRDITKLTVGEIMDNPFPTINDNTPFSIVCALLQHDQAIIVKKKDNLVGIITRADLFKIVEK